MQINRDAREARARLGASIATTIQLYGLTAAVRALLATHPEPEKSRAVFDQLLDQMLAQPGFLADSDQGIILRDFAATLFQPPVVL